MISKLSEWVQRLCRRDSQRDLALQIDIPTTVRIDASTCCQLRCDGCGFQKRNGRELGYGHLSFNNFKAFLDDNPSITRVELSNYGEIFLNPELIKIMEYACEKGVLLEASMGVNFNTVTDEQLQALVDYSFHFLSFSIDGASQESYSKYRICGDFEIVIANIRKLQDLKREKASDFPLLQWQFVPNEFNEDEVLHARDMARELDIPIVFKLNFMSSYSPKNPERLKCETGLSEVTRDEFLKKYNIPYLNDDCLQVFFDPQFNWDGSLLGCCRNEWRFFHSNLFRDGLEACLDDEGFRKMKEFLLLRNPRTRRYKNIPCLTCSLWRSRQAYGSVLRLP